MPRYTKPLSDREVRTAKPLEKSYKLMDGSGLYILVQPDGAKYWRMNYTRPITKKSNTLSFGVYPIVTLAEARAKRDKTLSLLDKGIDPIEQRKAHERAEKIAAANTFKAVAEVWLESTDYAKATHDKSKYLLELPILHFGDRPLSSITPVEVLDVCRIAEKQGHLEKARKTLNKCSQVFRYGVATSMCLSDPTRDLRGALKAPQVTHQSALVELKDIGRLLDDIEHYTGTFTTIQALRLAPHIFIRPGELRSLQWSDIDFERCWISYTPPKTRRVTELQLIVPMSSQVVTILKELKEVAPASVYVFPARHTQVKCMSENTINQALRRMGWGSDEMCGHGFRATARTILEEELEYEPSLIEMQLGHRVKDANGRAYNRTRLVKRRTEMMQAWSDYLDKLRRSVD